VIVRKHTTPTRLTALVAIGVPGASRYVNFELAQGSKRFSGADGFAGSTYCALPSAD